MTTPQFPPISIEAEVIRVLGRQIQVLRNRAGLTQVELAQSVGYSHGTVASVEQGRRPPSAELLTAADTVLHAGGVLAEATDLVAHIRSDSRSEVAVTAFTAWHTYAPLLVPELLQTADYARAVLTGLYPPLHEEAVEEHLAALSARQDALLDRSPAPLVVSVLEEAVLHRPLGGLAVLRGQLAHLLDLARHRHVTLQVLPTAIAAHPGVDYPFTLLDPTGHRATAAAYADGRITTRRDEVRVLEQRYGALRAAALTPADSASLIEELLERSADAQPATAFAAVC